MLKPKSQRVRDPVHNLIEFGSDHFESTLWKVIQTPPFQRLRRIRQLGFSEFVFPGATHTRFAHSIGVFHTARLLMRVIRKYVDDHNQQYKDITAQHALAAALLHDVGHGMFSHAFEAIGKEFNWPMARHEDVSQKLIRESEIKDVLDDAFSGGFAQNVADVIAQQVPADLYGSVVSSQFDADRLDYMQRDRIMTGIQSSGVDPTWLLANLEVADVAIGADETSAGSVQTLVLGPKAVQTAESYVLALFNLYPNVYLHKATRAAEVVFQALMRRLVGLHAKGHGEKSGIPNNHPILRFIDAPDDLSRALKLDDTVFWGALPMFLESEDVEIRRLSCSLHARKLPRCIDIRNRIEASVHAKSGEKRAEHQARVRLACVAAVAALKSEQSKTVERARYLVDQYSRNPYKRFQDSKSPLNQILIRSGDGPPRDMGEYSPIVGHAETFNICRVYVFKDDSEAETMVENIMRNTVQEANNAS